MAHYRQENIQDRLNFLYKAEVSKDNLEHFLKSWKKLVTRNGKINLSIPWTETILKPLLEI